jgi:hypothetical protein
MPLPVFVSETLHHEAIDWATRVSANGGTISTTTLRAVSDFCAAIDRSGLRSSMYRLNLFAGGNLSGCLVPLYRSASFGGTHLGNATDTNANFVSGDFVETGSTGGLKGNGVNKWLNTGLTQANIGSVLNIHMSASGTSLETGPTGARAALVGAYTNAASNASILWARDNIFTGRVAYSGNFNHVTGTSTATESHVLFSRSSSTSSNLYQGGSSVSSNLAGASSSAGTAAFGVFAVGFSGGIASEYTAARIRMYSIGTSLNATQAAAFSAAVIQFNAALGR